MQYVLNTKTNKVLAYPTWSEIVISEPCKLITKEEAEQIERIQKHGPKYDQGKLDWSLLPFKELEELVTIYEFGQKKYYRDSWKQGFEYSKLFSAALRHMFDWWQGNKNDAESNRHLLAHAIWNLLTLMYMEMNKNGTDDRACNKEIEF